MNPRDPRTTIIVAILGTALVVAGLQAVGRWVDEHQEEIRFAVLGVITLAGMGLIAWANERKGFTGSIQADPRFWAGCVLLAFMAIVAVVSLVGMAQGWLLGPEPTVVPVVFPSPTPIPSEG